jgi:hypothetical protein
MYALSSEEGLQLYGTAIVTPENAPAGFADVETFQEELSGAPVIAIQKILNQGSRQFLVKNKRLAFKIDFRGWKENTDVW